MITELLDTHGQTPACVDIDPDTFFPHGREDSLAEPARKICRRCPVITDCLSYALTHGVDGIWGATTLRERNELRRRHNITPSPIELDLEASAS